jgi:hypothetical protein
MMPPLTPVQVTELRQVADRAKMAGHFDDGVLLHELLDAYEGHDALEEKASETQSTHDSLVETVEEAVETLENLADVPVSSLLPKLKAVVRDLRAVL